MRRGAPGTQGPRHRLRADLPSGGNGLDQTDDRSTTGGFTGSGVRAIRAACVTVLVLAATAAAAPAAQAFGIEHFFAGNCYVSTCGENATGPSTERAETELFLEAGGYVPFGITDFKVDTVELSATEIVPLGNVKNIRVNVPPGVVTNPQAIPKCSMAAFKAFETEFEPGGFANSESLCEPDTVIGENDVVTVVPLGGGHYADVPLSGKVYNLEPTEGVATTFGVALGAGAVLHAPLYFHTIIEGSVEWATNYHDYFVIKNVTPGLISSRLIFNGNKEEPGLEGSGGFIRNPTACVPPGPSTTTGLELESYEAANATGSYEAPLGTEECGLVEFAPTFLVTPETHEADHTDGAIAKVTVPQRTSEFLKPGTSDVKQAVITLPEGMTLNPSAAAGLAGCTASQVGINAAESSEFEIRPIQAVKCPSGSQIGTVSLEVPTLPEGSLTGNIYLGAAATTGEPEKALPITAPPYTVYMVAESARYGVQVRVKGTVVPDPKTGRLVATVQNATSESSQSAPEAPFNSLSLHFNGGKYAPIANPITCGKAQSTTAFTPYASEQVGPNELVPAVARPLSEFAVEVCAAPQFSAAHITQSTSVVPKTAAAQSALTFTLTRQEGQQYLGQLTATLPPGISAKIPSVPLCSEAQGNAGTCSAESLIGTVHVTAGSGTPYPFTGSVYLTEHYEGAPYGLSIVVPTAAGPFNFGNLVVRAKISINNLTAQVSVTVVKSYVGGEAVSGLPTIVGGIPIRVQELSMSITRANYILNPTSCGELKAQSSLTSTLGSTAEVSSLLAIEGCSALAFKPSFTAATNANTSRAKGASLTIKITQHPGEANIKSTVTSLPGLLPSRLSTLNHSCVESQAAANILACPASSKVGSVTAVTPTLPGTLSGPVYIVSHGGRAFPDLDLVLQGDGVQIILVGNTVIKGNITTTTFANNPDDPITNLALTLPMASNSLLSSNGSLCLKPLLMPTALGAQSGKQVSQKTAIAVANCLPITQHRASGHRAIITVKVPQAGRVKVIGPGLVTKTGYAKRSGKLMIVTTLGSAAVRNLNGHGKLAIKVRANFTPRKRGGAPFVSRAIVAFRR